MDKTYLKEHSRGDEAVFYDEGEEIRHGEPHEGLVCLHGTLLQRTHGREVEVR